MGKFCILEEYYTMQQLRQVWNLFWFNKWKAIEFVVSGKILQSEKACFISWGYKEYKKNNKFEILIGAEGCWVTALGNKVPENAFCAGNSEQGESLNVGRAKHENSIIVGKIHRRYNLCYLPYKGKEIEVTDFEVLVV